MNVGVSSSSKNNAAFVDPPFYIDCYATAYLYLQKQICQVESINLKINNHQTTEKLQKIYTRFHEKYYLMDGHKFGANFMAYQKDPDQCHAKYLIFTGKFDLNHLSRLADACKKQGIFVNFNEENQIQITHCERADNKKRPRTKENLDKGEETIKQEVQYVEIKTKKQKTEKQVHDS